MRRFDIAETVTRRNGDYLWHDDGVKLLQQASRLWKIASDRDIKMPPVQVGTDGEDLSLCWINTRLGRSMDVDINDDGDIVLYWTGGLKDEEIVNPTDEQMAAMMLWVIQ